VKEMLGVILGGGKGSRLFPLTLIRSKPAVPLGGKYRLVDIPISNCINSEINRIFVLTQYNSESLNRHITQTYRFGLFSQGFVDILAAEQTPESTTWYQGTADAVRQCLHHILNYDAKYILILSGDHLYRMDYRKLLERHRKTEAEVTLCVIPVPEREASGLGILKMERDGRISRFSEKPQEPDLLDSLKVDVNVWKDAGVSDERPYMASMGIYLFNTDVLVRVLEEEPKMDFGRDIIPYAFPRHSVHGFINTGYWEDIGTIRAFYEANLDLTSARPRFNFYDQSAPIYSHPRFLPPSRVQNCDLRRVLVSEGCEISDATIANSVIGIRSIIRDRVRLTRTLMMGADYYEEDSTEKVPLGIGRDTIIESAIVDKNARIGSGVIINNQLKRTDFDGENFYVRDGIVVIPKNAVIEDGARI
jgi:glucose-1-phosphate adenylyltransferase